MIDKEYIVDRGHWLGHGNVFYTESSFVVYLLQKYLTCLSEKGVWFWFFFLCLPCIFKEQDDLSPVCTGICVAVVVGGGVVSFVVSVYSSL